MDGKDILPKEYTQFFLKGMIYKGWKCGTSWDEILRDVD